MTSRVAISLFLLCIMMCCSPVEFDTEQQLIDFVHDPDNGLSKKTQAGNIQVTVTSKPTDLLVAQELRSNVADTASVSTARRKYSPYYYFILSLSEGNKEVLHTRNGMEAYSELVQTMSFRMGEYVTLTTSTADTIPVADFILNRTFNMSPSTNLLFAFSKQKADGKEWVQFNLNEFGLNTGNQRFRFLKKDLDQIPAIKFLKPLTP